MSAPDSRLSIDLGTSSTVAVLSWAGRIQPLLFDGSPLLPSAVCAEPDGGLLTGRDALHLARSRPHAAEMHPKRGIDELMFLLDGRDLPVPEVIAATLRRIVSEASRALGGGEPSVVLTHPAGWGPRRIAVLLDAAGRAGLSPSGLVPEPIAAACYFAHGGGSGLRPGEVGLVYDFGAGTLDLTLVRQDSDGPRVLAVGGLPELGSLDIDAAVFMHLGAVLAERDLELWQRLATSADPVAGRGRMRLWSDIRSAKEALSRTGMTFVPIPLFDDELPLGRATLEELARPLLNRTLREIRSVLRAAGWTRPPHRLFLVGGASRLPLVSTVLHRALHVAPILAEQPELVVAEGALYANSGPAVAVAAVASDTPSSVTAASAGPAAVSPESVWADITPSSSLETATALQAPAPRQPAQPPQRVAAARTPGRRIRAAVPALVMLGLLVVPLSVAGDGERGADGSPSTTATPTAPLPDSSASVPGSSAAARPTVGLTATDVPVPFPGAAYRFRPGHGGQIAVGQRGDVVIWNVASASEVTRLSGFPADIQGLAFSPDGALLAASGRTTDVWVWNVSEGRRIAAIGVLESFGSRGIEDLAFTPDGRGLIVNAGGRLDRWDTATFAVRSTVADTGGNRGIASFRLGAGGRLAIGNVTDYKTLYVWNLDNRRVVKQIDLPTYAIPAIQPNGSLVSIPRQDDVALWDAVTQQQVGSVPARHSASEGDWTHTMFSPDGRHLWTYSNGVTELWSLASRSSVVTLTGAKYPSSAQFSPDGRYLATAANSEIQVWDLAALLPSGG